jgi:hypothetical protein
MAGVEQGANVLRDRLVGYPAHRQPACRTERAAGEREAEDGRGSLGVRTEHFEEVAEPGQDDRVRMFGFHRAVFAEDGRVAGGFQVESCAVRFRHRRREVGSPNLRARSHAAEPTGSTCSCQAVASVTRATRNSPAVAVPDGSHATLFSRVRP